jgi:death-on-curing protein
MITVEHIIDFNHTSIQEFGGMFLGMDNLRHNGYSKLDYALEYASYASACPIEQAAYICEKIVNNHPFNDGNKRTAFFTCAVYLKMHGIDVLPVDSTIRNAIMQLITHDWDYIDFAVYLKDNITCKLSIKI